MSKVDNRRKIAFSLRPDNNPADDYLLQMFEGLSTAERARKYRAYLLTGAVLDNQAAAAASILGESLRAGQTLDDVRALLRGAMPELFDVSMPSQPKVAQHAPAPVQDAPAPQDDFAAGARQKFNIDLK